MGGRGPAVGPGVPGPISPPPLLRARRGDSAHCAVRADAAEVPWCSDTPCRRPILSPLFFFCSGWEGKGCRLGCWMRGVSSASRHQTESDSGAVSWRGSMTCSSASTQPSGRRFPLCALCLPFSLPWKRWLSPQERLGPTPLHLATSVGDLHPPLPPGCGAAGPLRRGGVREVSLLPRRSWAAAAASTLPFSSFRLKGGRDCRRCPRRARGPSHLCCCLLHSLRGDSAHCAVRGWGAAEVAMGASHA